MQFFNKILLLVSLLQVLVSGVLGLPTAPKPNVHVETESTNSALEVRATLEKRDSWDCKGSGMCSTVPKDACIQALGAFKIDGKTWWSEKRSWVKYDAFTNGHCLAMWTCGNPADYISAGNAGVSYGYNLANKAMSIYNQGGCKRCGSVWFWGSCRFTFNYCSSNCDG
ncbi:hypothetical protein TWF730_007359 [Orbilia blumenaviensis]|uniref:Uncharacterized protein n=1 Tax=Orbilia blumenaviensis TaxID=1796055 RepID=A0AAV9V7M6_9PEZI